MNKIKKLGIVLVALAMCMMLGVTGWAAGDVTYSATPKDATLCVSEKSQMVTVTITANKEIAITSMYLEVIIPEGWSINTVYGSDTVVIGEDNYNTETGKDLIVWYESEAGNKATTDLLTIVYDTSVNAKGTFTLGVENLELATMKDGYNLEVLTQETTVTTTVTIKDHEYTATGYTWNADNTECTASGKCVCGKTVTVTSTGVTSEQTKDPTCEEKGETTYTATFTETWAKTQTKTVEDPANHTSKEVTYVDNEGDTHTVKHTCCGATEEPVPHDFTNGDCVCGKKKGLKGDVNLDGKVDMNDFVALAKHIGEAEFITDQVAMSNADVTGNGTVDMDDFVKLAQYIGEVIPEL